MTPRRLWIQKVPTQVSLQKKLKKYLNYVIHILIICDQLQECDVVILFTSGTKDDVLMWLLGRLRAGSLGLVVNVRQHASSDCYGFYITAPFQM